MLALGGEGGGGSLAFTRDQIGSIVNNIDGSDATNSLQVASSSKLPLIGFFCLVRKDLRAGMLHNLKSTSVSSSMTSKHDKHGQHKHL